MKTAPMVTIVLLVVCLTGPLALAADPNTIPATIDIDPNTLNLKSRGNWVTCHIWLPLEYDVSDIDPASILLEGAIQAEWKWFKVEDQSVMVKFSRSQLQDRLHPAESVELTVTGQLADGTPFEGTHIIRVIGPPVPPFGIKKLKAKTNRIAGRHRIRISGAIDVTSADIADANSINVYIFAASDLVNPVYSESIDFDPGDVKKSRYRYKNRVRKKDPGAITSFRFDLRKHKFSLKARNLDLTGLDYPVILEIQIGDYIGVAESP